MSAGDRTETSVTLDDLMDALGWSEEYRRGVQAGWPEIERLRAVLRAIRDVPAPKEDNMLSANIRTLAAEGLRGE